jgi:hypothetical protein
MSVKVTDNTQSIINNVNVKSSIFLRQMADQIVKIAEPKTPKREGFLRRDIIKQVLGLSGKIKWTKDYAVYQEVKQFRNYTTPGTGPGFAEGSVKKGVSLTRQIAKKAGLI